MPQYRVTIWYPMEAEVTITAENPEEAEDKAWEMAKKKQVDFEDTTESFTKSVEEIDENNEEIEND